jgi:hypothetical protein
MFGLWKFHTSSMVLRGLKRMRFVKGEEGSTNLILFRAKPRAQSQ